MRLASLLFLLPLFGCHRERAVRMEIPQQCVRVKITDFTKPCVERKDGAYVCDQVVVHADCVQAIKR